MPKAQEINFLNLLCCSVVLRTVYCMQQALCNHLLTNFFGSVLILLSACPRPRIHSFIHSTNIYYAFTITWNAGELKMLRIQLLPSRSSVWPGSQRVFSLGIIEHHSCYEMSLQTTKDKKEECRVRDLLSNRIPLGHGWFHLVICNSWFVHSSSTYLCQVLFSILEILKGLKQGPALIDLSFQWEGETAEKTSECINT